MFTYRYFCSGKLVGLCQHAASYCSVMLRKLLNINFTERGLIGKLIVIQLVTKLPAFIEPE
jgi:hypothetical protein